MKRIARVGFEIALSVGLLASGSAAQNQDQTAPQNQPSSTGSSLGDYARQTRKEGGQPKGKPRVYDNDNLPKDEKLSIVGQPAPAPAPVANGETAAKGKESAAAQNAAPNAEKKGPEVAAAATGAKEPAKSAEEKQAAWKQWQQKIASLRNQVELQKREFDVTQREYQVRAAAFYADAGNRLRNSAAWDQQDKQYKEQLADKQKEIDETRQKLDDAIEQAHKAGVPSSMIEQ